MQYITIKGNIGKDGEIRSVRDKSVLSFSVGVKQGWGDNSSTNWFRVQVWGDKLAQTLHPKAQKGVGVVAIGELKIGEYNGKPSFDIDAKSVEFIGAPRQDGFRNEPQRERAPSRQEQSFGHDLEDDVPFD